MQTQASSKTISPVNTYSILDNDIIMGDEREYNLRVKDLSNDDRPREKLIKSGPRALNVAELLAVVLMTGTRKEGVLKMCKRITKEYGEKGIAQELDPKKICQDLAVPQTKACQIVASFELGRRYFNITKNGKTVIRTAKQAFHYLKDMQNLPKEQLRGIYLNSHFQVIHDEVISIGSLTSSIVHPREIFRPAISYASAAVIIAHNHPSGSVTATESDIVITEQLIKAGKIIGINLLDHIIIAGGKYSSIPADYS